MDSTTSKVHAISGFRDRVIGSEPVYETMPPSRKMAGKRKQTLASRQSCSMRHRDRPVSLPKAPWEAEGC